jgi:hypothetical protein
MKRALTTAAVLTVAGALVACSSSSHPKGSAQVIRQHASGAVSAGDPLGTSAPAGEPGVAASTLHCSDFPVDLIRSAVQKQVSSATVTVQDDSQAGNSEPVHCLWDVYTPGTDISSADRGMAQVSLAIDDTFEETPLMDPMHDADNQRQDFEDARTSAQKADNGQAENNATTSYHDVPGVGAEAYLDDTVHADDSGTTTQYNVALTALHIPRPFAVRVTVDYAIPQQGNMPSDASLDTVMKSVGSRDQLAANIAAAVLTKVR